jgi:Flp pilus assembly protein TadG
MNRSVYTSSERGAVLVFTVVALLAMMGIAALTVDLGVFYAASQEAQSAADAAALAGAGKLREGMDPDAAVQEAMIAASSNAVLNDSVTLSASDVKVGAWNAGTRQVIAWDPTAKGVAVQVTVRRTLGSPNGPVPTFFAKVWGTQYTQTSRTAVAGLFVNVRPRNPVSLMIVQDGSTSFQQAWSQAIDADAELLRLINGVSVTGDAAGMVTFNAKLSTTALSNLGLTSAYKLYPEMNRGIKYTTTTSGKPVKTTETGVVSSGGQVRPMVGSLTDYDPGNHTILTAPLDNATKLLKAGNAWGDTDTAAGLNYAIDCLNARAGLSTTEKVIVLVSDGKPHDVDGASATRAREVAAVAAADRAENDGIRIHVVTLEGTSGVNFEFNESLVRNGGYSLRAADASKLRDLLISFGAIEVGHPSLLR